MKALTKRQWTILKYMLKFEEKKGHLPSYRKLAKHFRVKSANGMHQHVKLIKRKLETCPFCNSKIKLK